MGTKLRDAIHEEVHTSWKRFGMYTDGKSEGDKAEELVDNLEHRMLSVINDLVSVQLEAKVANAQQKMNDQRKEDILLIERNEKTIENRDSDIEELKARNNRLHVQIKLKDKELGKLRGQVSRGVISPEIVDMMQEEINFLRNLAMSNTTHGESDKY